MASFKVALRYIITLLIVSTFFQCATDAPEDNCAAIGTWELETANFTSCMEEEEALTLKSIGGFCVILARGEICTESQWTFTDSGMLTIDIYAVFGFDDDRKEITKQLDWDYSILEGDMLDICFDQKCATLACKVDNERLILTFVKNNCRGELIFLPV